MVILLLPRRKDKERERDGERGGERGRELTNSRRKQKDESSFAGLLCLSINTKTNSSPADFHEIPSASKQTREVNIPDKFQSLNEAAHTLIPANFSYFPVEIFFLSVQLYIQFILTQRKYIHWFTSMTGVPS